MFYFQLANLALLSNTTKTRLLFICRKKDTGFRSPHDHARWALLESLQGAAVAQWLGYRTMAGMS
ncbi:UNVERIFIED_CONTAM: hypothetical protein NCL1_10864 [Trichonephila clavipes]